MICLPEGVVPPVVADDDDDEDVEPEQFQTITRIIKVCLGTMPLSEIE